VAHRHPLIRRGAGDPGLFYVPPHLSPSAWHSANGLPTKRLRAQSGTHVQTHKLPRPFGANRRGALILFFSDSTRTKTLALLQLQVRSCVRTGTWHL
jgi:hypothetical protein